MFTFAQTPDEISQPNLNHCQAIYALQGKLGYHIRKYNLFM